jgi:hypothetical protein
MTDVNVAVIFSELVRRAQAGLVSSFFAYCATCGKKRRWCLVGETSTQEIYQCETCQNSKIYTVR